MIKRSLKKDKKRIEKIRKDIEKIEKLGYYFTAGTIAKKEGFFSDAYRNFSDIDSCIENLYTLIELVSPKKDLCAAIIGKKVKEKKEKNIEEKNEEIGLTADQIMELRAKKYEKAKENEENKEYENLEPLKIYKEKCDHGNWNQVFSNKVDYDFIRPFKRYITEKQFSFERTRIYN